MKNTGPEEGGREGGGGDNTDNTYENKKSQVGQLSLKSFQLLLWYHGGMLAKKITSKSTNKKFTVTLTHLPRLPTHFTFSAQFLKPYDLPTAQPIQQ